MLGFTAAADGKDLRMFQHHQAIEDFARPAQLDELLLERESREIIGPTQIANE
jgi:hypothetical protein